MLYRKTGFPEEDELVFCTVTKIQYNSVFVNLDDYDKQGMIHISEISPGRIRNIRDFVKEGKKIVCKVLRVNQEKGYIDLSLRRVTESQKRNKISEIQQEQKAEKIIEIIAGDLKIDLKKLYEELMKKIAFKYPLLHMCFEEAANDRFDLEELKLDKRLTKTLIELIKQRIKPKKIEIKGHFLLQSYQPEGINDIKDALKKIEQEEVKIIYEGAGKYKLTITSNDYKKAEKILKKSESNVLDYIQEHNGKGEFIRE